MAIDARLLEVLACPEDKGPLLYLEADRALYNPRLRRRYRVEDDVPVMLVEEAVTLSAADHEALMAKVQALGLRPNFEA